MSLVLDYNDPQDREIIELEEIKDKETIEIEEHRKLINSLPKRVQKTKRKELRDNFIKTVLDKKTQFLKPPQEARIPSADPLAWLKPYNQSQTQDINKALANIPHTVNKYVLSIAWKDFPEFQLNHSLLLSPLPTLIKPHTNPDYLQFFIHQDPNGVKSGVNLYKDNNLIQRF